ncbi:MAG TPA: transketolase C-terminal domain-containing protein, partial [Dongiaceae bacterium]
IAGARKILGWDSPPFVIPEPLLREWREIGAKGRKPRMAWADRVKKAPAELRSEFARRNDGKLPADWKNAIAAARAEFITSGKEMATRSASGAVLDHLAAAIPELLGGSADLTPSNNTKAKGMPNVTAPDYTGRYMHYGVREHAMVAAMSGIALHRGFIPYGGTFLVFTDYCRPAIRLASLMGQRVIYVMTHDSIGLGEDGPTHQPIEHLAALRAIPNLLVFRPADTVETLECWAYALAERHHPSLLALSRQAVPAVRLKNSKENLAALGGYILARAEGRRQATILASGTEVSIALAARELLQKDGIGTAVVSLPCWKLFDAQPEDYRRRVLGRSRGRVAVEAASPFGWERYVGSADAVIGMRSFGASAPAGDLYKHFGITAEAVAAAAKARL